MMGLLGFCFCQAIAAWHVLQERDHLSWVEWSLAELHMCLECLDWFIRSDLFSSLQSHHDQRVMATL